MGHKTLCKTCILERRREEGKGERGVREERKEREEKGRRECVMCESE